MRHFAEHLLFAAGLAASSPVAAQTIADYARAQRTVIEASISRQSPATPALPSLLPSGPNAVPLPVGRTTPDVANLPAAVGEASPGGLGVTGIVTISDRRFAEVLVDGAPFVLSVGDTVPGTIWTLKTISAVDVVMTSSGRRSVSRTFHVGGSGK